MDPRLDFIFIHAALITLSQLTQHCPFYERVKTLYFRFLEI